MIEVIGALFRWLQLASNMILIGGCVFLAIAARANTAFDAPWLSPSESGVTVAWRSRFCWACWACWPRLQLRPLAWPKMPGVQEPG